MPILLKQCGNVCFNISYHLKKSIDLSALWSENMFEMHRLY